MTVQFQAELSSVSPLVTISQSEIAAWLRCPRQWYLKYYLGTVPEFEAVTGNMQLGGRVHTALEGWYGYGLDPLAVIVLLYEIELQAHPDDTKELRAEQDLATAMVEGYVEWTAAEGTDAESTVVATETDLQIPMPGRPVILRARLDAVRQLRDGGLVWDDYKTSDSFAAAETLQLNPQFRFYSLMQRLAAPEGPPVLGGRVVTLRRVKRTSKSKPPYYARDEFRFNEDVLEAEWRRVSQVVGEILAARQALDDAAARGVSLDELNMLQQSVLRPNLMPKDCSWSCPFSHGLCPMMDDGSNWPLALAQSGRWRQDDPYSYYRNDDLSNVRARLASQ